MAYFTEVLKDKSGPAKFKIILSTPIPGETNANGKSH
jgi:hypothetical protein